MTNSSRITANNDNDEIDLARLFGHLIDRRWLILSITSLFCLFGISYALLSTPIYSGSALIQVEKKSGTSSLLSKMGDLGDMVGGQPEAAAEIELLKSRMVLGKTVADLNLEISVTPDYFPVIGQGIARIFGEAKPQLQIRNLNIPTDLLNVPLQLAVVSNTQYTLQAPNGELLQGEVGKILQHNNIELLITDISAKDGQNFTLKKQNTLSVISELQKTINITEQGKNTGMIVLSLEGPSPKKIQHILDSVSKNYLQQNVARKSEEVEKSILFLDGLLPDVRGNLSSSEEFLNQYRQKNESVDLSLEAKSALETMVQLEKQLNDLTFREAELQQLYTKQHPAYIALLDKRQTLLKTKEVINKSIQKMPKTQQEILRLTRDVQVGQEIYVQLLNKQQELRIMKAGTIGNVRIIDDAAVQYVPVKPKKPLMVVLATLLGGMLSIAMVLIKTALHRGIESPDELEALGVAVYATIPLSTEQNKIETLNKRRKNITSIDDRLLSARNPADLAIESLRSLRTSLHFAMLEARNNIIMITGPGPGLGKSFISSNFAATLASGGKRVLVIDADLRKGYMQKILGNNDQKGLADFLSGQLELSSIVKTTDIPQLDFMSRGSTPPNPSELLMHPRLSSLMEWASQHYDFVLIDTPPILAVTDAAIVGRLAGTTLLVTRFGLTTVKETDVAIKRFEQNGIEIKGILLNGIEKKASSYYGAYGYYQYAYSENKK